MDNQPKIETRPQQAAMVIRTRCAVGDLPAILGEGYDKVLTYIQSAGKYPSNPPFVAYYNLDMQHLDIELGFPLAEPLPESGDIHPVIYPAGDYASILYIGAYDQCAGAYEELGRYVQVQGREPTGVAFEYYLNDPSEPPFEEPQTLIVYPLK